MASKARDRVVSCAGGPNSKAKGLLSQYRLGTYRPLDLAVSPSGESKCTPVAGLLPKGRVLDPAREQMSDPWVESSGGVTPVPCALGMPTNPGHSKGAVPLGRCPVAGSSRI